MAHSDKQNYSAAKFGVVGHVQYSVERRHQIQYPFQCDCSDCKISNDSYDLACRLVE